MNRREFSRALAATSLASLSTTALSSARRPSSVTRWVVRQSEGFDALYFMGPLSGDPFLTPYYAKELAAFRPRLPADVLAFIANGDRQAKAKGAILSATLAKFFSMGPDETIDALIGSLDNAETVLKPRLQASDDWGGEQYWSVMMQFRPPLKKALIAMRDAGFGQFRRELYQPIFDRRAPQLRAALARHDVVPEIQFLTGIKREPRVEIVMNYFDYPRSQRLFGQRFITHHSYSDDTTFWVAGHELLHPPFDREGASFKAALAVLGRDPFVVDLITRRDPGLGMQGDLAGYVEECCTQALDHLVSLRMGMKRDPRVDWGSGQHNPEILAACIYGLLRQDRYERIGGNFDRWLGRATASGRLAPASLSAAGARILGAPPDRVWRPYVPLT